MSVSHEKTRPAVKNAVEYWYLQIVFQCRDDFFMGYIKKIQSVDKSATFVGFDDPIF